MRLRIEAMRPLALTAALALDLARRHPDPETRKREQARADLLTPVVKAWCTDSAVEIASLASRTARTQCWRSSSSKRLAGEATVTTAATRPS